ncbi:MAG: dephospho-CoA kinase [Eubacteriaceae bacterium]|nr:dephospho-CoA kinase [Eubacteriaceae bacterium]
MKIGLTGGIGSGKSTVTDYLIERGYRVIDADKVARDITEPGSSVLEKLKAEFGSGVIRKDGSLDRKQLAAVVFADDDKRKILDSITHREIYDIIVAELNKRPEETVFADAALLFETGLDREVDMVWVVTADKDERVKRVTVRDDAEESQVLARIESQMDDEEKCRAADEVIDNSGSKEDLRKKVSELLDKYA